MRFWDTSAIVPLCVMEPATPQARALAESDAAIAVWWATRTECVSAFARQMRAGELAASVAERARRALMILSRVWSEILPTESLRDRAERLLALHPLRSADAFQLAAALVWARERTREHEIVCFDERLRAAAMREGFVVLPTE